VSSSTSRLAESRQCMFRFLLVAVIYFGSSAGVQHRCQSRRFELDLPSSVFCVRYLVCQPERFLPTAELDLRHTPQL
jgi:hypothetical protein